jgi:hypothetical protein
MIAIGGIKVYSVGYATGRPVIYPPKHTKNSFGIGWDLKTINVKLPSHREGYCRQGHLGHRAASSPMAQITNHKCPPQKQIEAAENYPAAKS